MAGRWMTVLHSALNLYECISGHEHAGCMGLCSWEGAKVEVAYITEPYIPVGCDFRPAGQGAEGGTAGAAVRGRKCRRPNITKCAWRFMSGPARQGAEGWAAGAAVRSERRRPEAPRLPPRREGAPAAALRRRRAVAAGRLERLGPPADRHLQATAQLRLRIAHSAAGAQSAAG